MYRNEHGFDLVEQELQRSPHGRHQVHQSEHLLILLTTTTVRRAGEASQWEGTINVTCFGMGTQRLQGASGELEGLEDRQDIRVVAEEVRRQEGHSFRDEPIQECAAPS